jgi:hypothetical protein
MVSSQPKTTDQAYQAIQEQIDYNHDRLQKKLNGLFPD